MEDFDTSTARADAEKELQPHLKILNHTVRHVGTFRPYLCHLQEGTSDLLGWLREVFRGLFFIPK